MEVQGINEKVALARLVTYCETEAAELRLPFVAYCLSLAKGALVEEGTPASAMAIEVGPRRQPKNG